MFSYSLSEPSLKYLVRYPCMSWVSCSPLFRSAPFSRGVVWQSQIGVFLLFVRAFFEIPCPVAVLCLKCHALPCSGQHLSLAAEPPTPGPIFFQHYTSLFVYVWLTQQHLSISSWYVTIVVPYSAYVSRPYLRYCLAKSVWLIHVFLLFVRAVFNMSCPVAMYVRVSLLSLVQVSTFL